MIIWKPLQESSWKWSNVTLYHGATNKFSSIAPSTHYTDYERYGDLPPAFFLTIEPIFALQYAQYNQSKNFNRDGYLYEYKLKKGLNIFDATNTEDKKALIDYFKKNGNNPSDIKPAKGIKGTSWITLEEYPNLLWGIKRAGFDGWTMTEVYQDMNGDFQDARNIGLLSNRIQHEDVFLSAYIFQTLLRNTLPSPSAHYFQKFLLFYSEHPYQFFQFYKLRASDHLLIYKLFP
jgi:hypothetical protein